MNRVLLDTNAFIWISYGYGTMGKEARNLLENESLYLSSLSVLEIQIKCSIGKLKFPDKISWLAQKHQVQLLDSLINEIEDYQIFDESNKDPFDNGLLTIAKHHKMLFITSDKKILKLRKKYSWIIDSKL